MDMTTAQTLREINNRFYREHGASFSATRTLPWPGWRRCLEILQDALPDRQAATSVLDLACGNLRFETFLEAALPGCALTCYAVDNCDAIVSPTLSTIRVRYQSLDILDALRAGRCLNNLLEAPLCDLSVSFGFMHHVPLQTCRKQALLSLVRQTRPGGYAIVSFWQFLSDKALADKARASHERATRELSLEKLDDGDFLLGWKNLPGAYRYCHSFSDAEIDHLAASVAPEATVLSRFTSDGRTNALNTYLVLRRREE
jgi:SAM-dependent methyltransferase